MRALFPIFFYASHVCLAACLVPKFDVERTCRPAAAAATLPGRESSACQRDEQTARSRLESNWSQYTTAQRRHCTGFAALGRAPSYVELLTCLEMAKQVKE